MRCNGTLRQVKATSVEVGRAVFNKISTAVKGSDFGAVLKMYDISQKAVQAVDPKAQLFMFGSTVAFGFHEKGSDIDFVALNEQDLLDGKKPDANAEIHRAIQSEFLGRVSEVVRKNSPTWSINLVRRVRVPVLRVKGGATIDFDITAHRRNGVRNSALLRAYVEQLPLARWVCMTVKRWSKQVGLNASTEAGCITSYGFNIMVVYYLLRRGLVSFVDPDDFDLSTISPMPKEMPLLPLTTEKELEALGELCQGFLTFYLKEFNPQTEVITLNRGADVTPKSALTWTTTGSEMGGKAHFHWCIEDPYEMDLNVGRLVTPLKLTLLRRHMERAVDTAFLSLPPTPTPKSA